MVSLAETRKFSIHPDIIFSLIQAQAGTLGKALAECVMNSIDAFATRVDVTFDTSTITVQDNGQGFRDRDEVLAWFEVLGFPHDEGNHRRFGKFGMGRAQLWSYASTIWRTNDFELDVNIKERGLDYELRELLVPAPGLTIEGTFYEPLGLRDRQSLETQFKELVQFAPAQIYLNGRRISCDPAKEQWTQETDEFWMKIEPARSGHLVIYNQGVLVGQTYAGHHGVSGVVCTKPGHPLELNMARNMVLESKCKVWRRIAAHFPSRPEPKRKAVERPSEATLISELSMMLGKDAPTVKDAEELLVTEALTTVAGRWLPLSTFGDYRAPTLVCAAPKGDALGKLAQTRKLALVLDEQVLRRFEVATVEELGAKLTSYMEGVVSRKDAGWQAERTLRNLKAIKWANSLREALPELEHECEVLGTRDLTEIEQVALQALTRVKHDLYRLVQRESPEGSAWRDPDWKRGGFELFVGKSPTHAAWTDGGARLVLERKSLDKLARSSISGWCVLMRLMLTELLYDKPTLGRKALGEAELQMLNRLADKPEFYDLALRACYFFARHHKSRKAFAKRMVTELDDMVTVSSGSTAAPTTPATVLAPSVAAPAAAPVALAA